MRHFPLVLSVGLILGCGAMAAAQTSGYFGSSTELSYLAQASVRDELKLSPEQIAKIDALRTSLTVRSLSDAGTDRESRSAELAKRVAAVRPQLESLLNAEQWTRFRQIVRQQQRKSGLATLVRADEIREPLKVTEEQLRQIETIQSNLTNARRGLDRGAPPAKLQELIAAADQDVEKLLTAEQNARLATLLGAAFTGEIRTFGFAAPEGFGRGGRGSTGGSTTGSAFGRGSPSATQLRTLPFRLGALSGPSLGLLSNAQAQRELKLSADQTQQVAALPAVTRDDPAPSLDFLQPEQRNRLSQLTLQYAQQRYGPLGPFHYAEVAEGLRLTPEQRQAIAAIAEEDRKAVGRLTSPATADGVASINAETRKRLEGALTEEQRARWKDLLGAPFAGQLSTAGTSRGSFGGPFSPAFRVGVSTRSAWSYLSQADVLSDLKVSDDQRQRLAALGEPISARSDEIKQVLTADQLERLLQIQLQYLQSRSGAAYIFRYTDVVEALALTDEQKQRIQTLGAGLPDRAGAEAASDPARKPLDEILTEEQQGRLRKLLGEPFKGEVRSRFGAPRRGGDNPARPAGST